VPLAERFGRYEVLEPLGQGAMGAVYKARDPAIDRLVAVKTVNAALLALPDLRGEFLARFHQEARAAGRISHPAVVSVYDVGVDEATGTPYIVMEYVAGVPLSTVLRENPTLPVNQALDVVEQVGAALTEAHAHGVLHRDIKPANVLLDTRGRVKVGDFGVARLEGSDLTRTGVGLGTPGYLAPEVMEGGRADERSDLYALGVVAYQLLVGQPFKASAGSLPPDRLRRDVNAAISAAVMRALSRRPDDRQPSVARFLEDLAAARAQQTRTLVEATAGPPRSVSKGRRRALIAGLVALGAALLLGAMLAVWRLEPAAPSPLPRATPSTAARPAPQETRSAEPTQIDDSKDRRGDRGDSPKGSKPGRGKGPKKRKKEG
jgi:serine/threonine-protein kinase